MDEALGILAKQRRAKLQDQAKARMKADAGTLEADDKNEKTSLAAWENFRDTYMLRAADLRSPAPNGHFLREFGQSDRELVENANEGASVGQALMLLNGKTFTHLMNRYTQSQSVSECRVFRANHRCRVKRGKIEPLKLLSAFFGGLC
jgi:hypothetical protein